MNKIAMLPAIITLFFLASCTNDTSSEKPMEKTDAIQLKGMTNVTAAIGDEFVYSGVVHGSVGFTMSYQFDGDPAIEMTGETLEYFHPEKMKAGMKGADEATLTWKFKAVAAGKVTVHFIKEYRFKEESRETIKIIVK